MTTLKAIGLAFSMLLMSLGLIDPESMGMVGGF